MRGGFVLTLVALVAAGLAGCVTEGPEPLLPDISGERLEVYEYRFDGDGAASQTALYGWMARLTNHGTGPVHYAVLAYGPSAINAGLATNDGWQAAESTRARPQNDTLPPDEEAVHVLPGGTSVLWLFETRLPQGAHNIGFAVHAVYAAETGAPGTVRTFTLHDRAVEAGRGEMPIRAGEHVHTLTVGVWVNGTSFYTNIEGFGADEAFPAGFDAAIDGTPLPIYVYDQDRSEQPNGSKDRCYFTTIQGYNALLRTQVERVPGVRFLAPEEAYTVEGAEEHDLYGDALVFLNQIVLREPINLTDPLPDPRGACFDPERYRSDLPLA